MKGNSRPIPFVDDIAVAPERLPEFLIDVQNLLKTERITATLFGHAAHGQIHIRPFLDLNLPEDVAKMNRLADALYERVIELEGVIAGEHALGLSRSWYARRQLGNRYPICRRIKELFDPKGILNPGKLITDAPQRVSDNLRPSLAPSLLVGLSTASGAHRGAMEGDAEREVVEDEFSPTVVKPAFMPILSWTDEGGIGHVAQSCNGCGRCRTNASQERMCPMFRVGRDEESSPRAKANVFASDHVRQVAKYIAGK